MAGIKVGLRQSKQGTSSTVHPTCYSASTLGLCLDEKLETPTQEKLKALSATVSWLSDVRSVILPTGI